jgi:hypothetical protein
MNFKLRSIKGRSRKLYKEWLDETRRYRITWSREVDGVRVPPHFHACVRITLPDGREMWDFAGCHRPYKTFKKAAEACEIRAKFEEELINEISRRIADKLPLNWKLGQQAEQPLTSYVEFKKGIFDAAVKKSGYKYADGRLDLAKYSEET